MRVQRDIYFPDTREFSDAFPAISTCLSARPLRTCRWELSRSLPRIFIYWFLDDNVEWTPLPLVVDVFCRGVIANIVEMNEHDLMKARAMVENSKDNSPGGSPGPLRKTMPTHLQDKLKTFRWVNFYSKISTALCWIIYSARGRKMRGNIDVHF